MVGYLSTWQVGVTGAEESQRPHTVVESDHNDVASGGNLLPVVQIILEHIGAMTRSNEEGTTVDPDHDGQVSGNCGGWSGRKSGLMILMVPFKDRPPELLCADFRGVQWGL